MDGTYDEDLSENPFFIEMRNEYAEIFQHCISEGWIICVPRIGSLTSHLFVLQDFLGHILVQSEELPETHFSTLTEKPVNVLNKVITLDNEGIPFQSHILFEETFYTEDFNKYRVWCVESVLEPTITKEGRSPGTHQTVSSLRDCVDLLWTESAGQDVLENIEVLVKEFLKRNKLESANLTKQKDLIAALYTNCLQKAFRNKRLKDKCHKCKHMMQNVKLSVETFLQHHMYADMMNGIRKHTAYDDSYFNKIMRNLSDIQLRDLDIRKDLYDRLPEAKKNLAKIQNSTTILEKVVCIKKTMNAINNHHKNGDKFSVDCFLTADDLLSVLVFLVIKCGLPNWIAQVTYMKEFRYSSSSAADADETSFLITTLEAVIEHIKSGILSSSPYPEAYEYCDESITDDASLSVREHSIQSLTESAQDVEKHDERDSVAYLFSQIRLSNYGEVKIILEQNHNVPVNDLSLSSEEAIVDEALKTKSNYFSCSFSLDEVLREGDYTPLDLCHPLCNCRKCHKIVYQSALKTTPTVESRDSHGFTPLHIASANGKTQIVELILTKGANVNVTDYNGCTPLHYASLRGHQNALLLLLHGGANLNFANNDGNTPLHLASNNGHDSCVKALVYFSEHSKKELSINKVNESGNTALHLASKWGYESIVSLMIEYGADPNIVNAKGKTAFDYANNLRILNVLQLNQPNLQDYIVINSFSPDNNGNHNEESAENPLQVQCIDNVSKTQVHENIGNKFEPVRPQTIGEIRNVERLLQSIIYGDTKLACFYMNINLSNNNKTFKKSIDIDGSLLCHPLCNCKKCVGDDTSIDSQKRNLNMCNADGCTALHFAVKHDRMELCNILLKNNADPNLRNKNNQTPLHLAAQHGRYSISEMLIAFGAYLNMVDIMGNTPLHVACTVGCTSIVRLLLNKGAITNLTNISGKTALDEAHVKVAASRVEVLKSGGDSFSELGETLSMVAATDDTQQAYDSTV